MIDEISKNEAALMAAYYAKEMVADGEEGYGLALYKAAKETGCYVYEAARALRYLKDKKKYLAWEKQANEVIDRAEEIAYKYPKDWYCEGDYDTIYHEDGADFLIDILQGIGGRWLLNKTNHTIHDCQKYTTGHTKGCSIPTPKGNMHFKMNTDIEFPNGLEIKISLGNKMRKLHEMEASRCELPYWVEHIYGEKLYSE